MVDVDRSSSSHWDLHERRVRISESVTIAPPTGGGGQYIARLPDGSIVTNASDKEGAYSLISFDEGRTWARAEDHHAGCPWNHVQCLADGTILAYEAFPCESLGDGKFTYKMWRGKDTYDTLRPETCTMFIPDAVPGTGDDGKVDAIKGMVYWSPRITEFPDGRLLATMYGWFAEDTIPMTDPGFQAGIDKGIPYRRCRSIAIVSEDRGCIWRYVSTIASPLTGTTGPCEPSMLRVGNGDLIAILRVGRRTALYQARSRDNGQTWGPPQPLHTFGVAPYAIVMSDGTVACAYGLKRDLWGGQQRREARIMFSFDGGHSWAIDKLVYGGEAGSYPGICEISPGVLLFSYDPSVWSMPGDVKPVRRCVRVARITVLP